MTQWKDDAFLRETGGAISAAATHLGCHARPGTPMMRKLGISRKDL